MENRCYCNNEVFKLPGVYVFREAMEAKGFMGWFEGRAVTAKRQGLSVFPCALFAAEKEIHKG